MMAIDIAALPAPPPVAGFKDADFRADPYPFYRHLLAEAPISTEPDYGVTMLARYEDIARLLRDPRLSSDDRNSGGYAVLVATGALSAEQQALLGDRSFLRRDPPDHTRLRRLAGTAFAPAKVMALRPQVQRIVDEAVDDAAGRGRMDLIAELAYPLPMTIISRLLGVPAEDHLRIRSASRAQLCCSFEARALPGELQERNCMMQSELTEYFDDLVARRRRDPGDDLISALIAAEEEGEQLTPDEVNATARLLLVSGHETTVSLIANGMLALLHHPDQLELLREQPVQSGRAVEEVMRYDPPFQFLQRAVIDDVEVGGYRIPRGSTVILWLAAGNRDAERFPDPDRFDISRKDIHHLAFGAGAHYCLGAPLARLQGEIALTTLARRLIGPRLEVDPPAYSDQDFHAIAELPIAFEGVRAA